MADKVALVTGSNTGIGFAIVKELLRRGVGTVFLTARDVKKGQDAVQALNKEGYKPVFHQLNVTDNNSVKTFADHVKQKHGGLDILINNAAVIDADFLKTTYEDSKRVIDTNYFGMVRMQEHFFPLLRDNARVINVTSECGHPSNLRHKFWIDHILQEDLTVEGINTFINWYLDSLKNGTLNEDDFAEIPLLALRISKIGVCALTRVQQRLVGRGISVNSLNPGLVKTNMTKGYGDLTIDEASKTPVYLALDADQSIKGRFIWFDRTERDWTDASQQIYFRYKALQDLINNSPQA